MMVDSLEHAKLLSVRKWEFFSRFDFTDPMTAHDILFYAHPEFKDLLHGSCGFCCFFHERNPNLTFVCMFCPLFCLESSCCRGCYSDWSRYPCRENARRVLEVVKGVEV